jgi:hypothetical protein
MYGITLPPGSHKSSSKYAYEDLNLSTYKKEVLTTLMRSLAEKYGKTQKEIKSEVSTQKKKIEDMIEKCFPDTSVTNCTKKILDEYSSFFKKELKEERIILEYSVFEYWDDMNIYMDEETDLNEAESNLDSTIQKYAEEYAGKIIRGKKISASTLARILKKVHSRGMEAFRKAPQSVRPWIRKMGDPAGAIVWGTSRIKAFLKKSKGTWHKFDSDLAEDVKKAAK